MSSTGSLSYQCYLNLGWIYNVTDKILFIFCKMEKLTGELESLVKPGTTITRGTSATALVPLTWTLVSETRQ
ncbi:hypothetical protein Hanom_Chr03g00215911 [Helianthus anomalus]